jgi:adenine-specific DNA-methyltransferase
MSQVRHSTIIPEAFSLVDQVDLVRLRANKHINQQQRVALGQFMTPAAIARLMASMLICDTEHVSLLDAGAGVGSLLSAEATPALFSTRHIKKFKLNASLQKKSNVE